MRLSEQDQELGNMTYRIEEFEIGGSMIYCDTRNCWFPFDVDNGDYQEMLDDISNIGESCFEGDIPSNIQEEADSRNFNIQLGQYRVAVNRLDKYPLATGRVEVTESVPTGRQVWSEDDDDYITEMETVIVKTFVPALEPTVTIEVSGEGFKAEKNIQTIDNPLITRDNAERADAQAVVDATPSEVIDAYNAL